MIHDAVPGRRGRPQSRADRSGDATRRAPAASRSRREPIASRQSRLGRGSGRARAPAAPGSTKGRAPAAKRTTKSSRPPRTSAKQPARASSPSPSGRPRAPPPRRQPREGHPNPQARRPAPARKATRAGRRRSGPRHRRLRRPARPRVAPTPKAKPAQHAAARFAAQASRHPARAHGARARRHRRAARSTSRRSRATTTKRSPRQQRVRSVSLAAERGSIFDRNGNDLALSVPQHTIYADPRLVKNPSGYARKLAPIVDVDRVDLENRLGQPDTAFVYVARKVDDKTAARVEALGLARRRVPCPSRSASTRASRSPARCSGSSGIDNDGLGGLENEVREPAAGASPARSSPRRTRAAGRSRRRSSIDAARAPRRRPRAHARPVAPVRGGEAADRPGGPAPTRAAASRSSPT